jgi:hypothetical protein
MNYKHGFLSHPLYNIAMFSPLGDNKVKFI